MKVIVMGDGGHSRVIQDMISTMPGQKIFAILDDKYENIQRKHGILYAPLENVFSLMDDRSKIVIAIGDNVVRKKLVQLLNLKEQQYLTVIAPDASVSKEAKIGKGTVIMPKAAINSGTSIGEFCIINTGAIIEHDNDVDNYVHISPNATLTGEVSIGEGAHIGAGATVIPGKRINEWSIVGAGSTVITEIPSYTKAVGSPARLLK
ncbi:acetyltransferase [Thalassobacillus pellis]|uniref:acetyltransferase n=1 Tax=Thalassobacillus pellis TaxID=748008 RepID=UPI00196005D3|nr:acetyltransferase [Thalassobacillus pellis]MBM7553634.1 acetyltransferase EpsM [Thalassobacillus pellis]